MIEETMVQGNLILLNLSLAVSSISQYRSHEYAYFWSLLKLSASLLYD